MTIPIYVTRLKVGRGNDIVLVSVESPGGDVSKGEVENQEAVRMVMSLSTFTEVTELFVSTLEQIKASKLLSVAKGGNKTPPDEGRREPISLNGVFARSH